MLKFIKHMIGSLLGATLATSAAAMPGPYAVTDVAEALLRAYNARDAAALHRLLSPALQLRHSVEEMAMILAHCRALTHDIERFSIPSWGTRYYGFFGVFAENAVFEMILEIDESARIVHWTITDDVTANEQQCAIAAPG